MPFDLRLRRSPPIELAEVETLMQGAPARRRDPRTWWVFYPDDAPWFALREERGEVVLSASVSAPRYLRDFANMFDQALALASAMRAVLFEEAGGREVTSESIDELLAAEGPYVALQLRAFRHVQAKLDAEALAPLEFPRGPVDVVPEYLVFHAVPGRSVTPADLRRSLGASLAVREMGGGSLLVESGDMALVKVLNREDGGFQVWPAHGRAPFSVIAPAVLFVAEAIAHASGGALWLNGHAYEPAVRQRAHELAAGLGVDFHEWIASAAAN